MDYGFCLASRLHQYLFRGCDPDSRSRHPQRFQLCSQTLAWDTSRLGNFPLPCLSSSAPGLQGLTNVQAVCVLTFTVNVYGIRILPTIQVVGGLCHVIFFLVLIVPLVLLAPRSTADFVFTAFLNEAGWKSDGVSWCVGLITVTFCFMGKILVRRLGKPITYSSPWQGSMGLST
jgi:hypothetical protein